MLDLEKGSTEQVARHGLELLFEEPRLEALVTETVGH